MALPILDGNQTAATLSTIITGGAHIPAHTVVSLGSQAISDITSGVSGSVVSISNFPSTQTIAGTVTANNLPLVGENFSSTTLGAVRSALYIKDTLGGSGFVGIGNDADEGLPVRVNGTALPISGTVTANVDAGSLISALDNFGQSYTAQIPVGIDQTGFGDVPISGTVTANVVGWDGGNAEPLRIGGYSVGSDASARLALEVVGVDGNPLPISGTVTVSNATAASAVFVKICGEREGAGSNEPREILTDDAGMLYVRLSPSNARTADPVIYDPVAGTAYINVRQQSGTSITVGNSVTIGSLPNGSLTTRFGSVATANLAFITSAVTNTSRKYLLAQNISAGTVTIGIGFSPTTTQGIQLAAGGGLTFDAFCPTGAVYWLGAVTGAAFTILEG